MIKFKKDYSAKIAALLIAVSFFLNSTVYGIELPNKFNLRSPLMTNSEEGRKRLKKGILRRNLLKAGVVALGILAVPVPVNILDDGTAFLKELNKHSASNVSLFIAEKMKRFRIVTLGRSHFNNYADEYAAKAIDDFIKRNPGKALIVGVEVPLLRQKDVEDYIRNGVINDHVSFVMEQYKALLQALRGHYLNGVYVQVVCYDTREINPIQAFQHDDAMANALMPFIEGHLDTHLLLTGGSKHLGLFKQIKKNVTSPSLAWILSNKFKGQIYTMDMQAPSADLVLRHKDGITISTVVIPENDLISYLWRTHHFSDMAIEVKNSSFGNIITINSRYKEIYTSFTGLELDDVDYTLREVWDGIVYIPSKKSENRGSIPDLESNRNIRAGI